MMTVVFYDPATGRIAQCDTSPRAWIEASGRAWVEVTEARPDWDVTHRVVDGVVVPIEEDDHGA